MAIIDVKVDGFPLSPLNIFMTEKPNLPSPKKKIKEIEVAGRSGKLVLSDGTYEPVDIELEFNMRVFAVGNKELEFNRVRSKISQMFSKTNSKLECTGVDGYFYKVSHYDVGVFERVSESILKFEVVAHTVDGLVYHEEEYKVLPIEQIEKVRVSTLTSPIYKITGNGTFALAVVDENGNGTKIGGQCSGDLVIDTERMVVYRESDKSSQNKMISGDIELLKLKPGENTIGFMGDTTLSAKYLRNEGM